MKKKQNKKVIVNKVYTFEDVYLPLKLYWGKAFGGQGGMAFDFSNNWLYPNGVNICEEDQIRIVGILNGEITEKTNTQLNLTYENGTIYVDGNREFIIIRGWGHLCGTGGLNLPESEAAIIQDNFAAYIIDKLTKS